MTLALADVEQNAQTARKSLEREAVKAKASFSEHAERVREAAEKMAAEIVANATATSAEMTFRAEQRDLRSAEAEANISERSDRLREHELAAKKAAARAAMHAEVGRRARALEQAQLKLTRRALDDPDLRIVPEDSPRGVKMNQRAMSDPEREAYLAPWGQVARAFARFVADAVCRIKSAFATLTSQRESVAGLVAAAKGFEAASATIPVHDRTPEIAATRTAAGLLSQAVTAASSSPGVNEAIGPNRDSLPSVSSKEQGEQR